VPDIPGNSADQKPKAGCQGGHIRPDAGTALGRAGPHDLRHLGREETIARFFFLDTLETGNRTSGIDEWLSRRRLSGLATVELIFS
jgi:hypothetical protein